MPSVAQRDILEELLRKLQHCRNLGQVILNTLSYQLQRDWFNLTPQAPAEIVGVIVAFGVGYVLLRRVMIPTDAATTLMVFGPFVGVVTTVVACTWVVVRAV